MNKQLIISCEHAGNKVPGEYRHLFEQKPEPLQTHRGIDIGALELTRTISEKVKREPYLHTVTRLLVDLNRSKGSSTLFSEYTQEQPLEIREHIMETYYQPHRQEIEQEIKKIIDRGDQVIHLGVHTFTPVWQDKERDVDVGFLYDPERKREQQFCRQWRKELQKRYSGLRLKMNEPYKGTMDGFTTYLRSNYPTEHYLGIELEVSQRFTKESLEEQWPELQNAIAHSLLAVLEELPNNELP